MGALILYTTPTIHYFTMPMGGWLTVPHYTIRKLTGRGNR